MSQKIFTIGTIFFYFDLLVIGIVGIAGLVSSVLDIGLMVYIKTNQPARMQSSVDSWMIYGMRKMKAFFRIPQLYVFRNHPFQNASIRIIST